MFFVRFVVLRLHWLQHLGYVGDCLSICLGVSSKLNIVDTVRQDVVVLVVAGCQVGWRTLNLHSAVFKLVLIVLQVLGQ